MKSPAQILHQTIKKQAAAYAVEFDMTVYEVIGVMTLATLEMWYEHDQPEGTFEFDEDEDEDE
tara:strand:- start:343 stop:531 length:189 start_codon:yes stop_codon:yes gene_type:complete